MKRQRIAQRLLSGLTLGLMLFVQVPAVALADGTAPADTTQTQSGTPTQPTTQSATSTRGPQGPLGPQGPIGPQGQLGPQPPATTTSGTTDSTTTPTPDTNTPTDQAQTGTLADGSGANPADTNAVNPSDQSLKVTANTATPSGSSANTPGGSSVSQTGTSNNSSLKTQINNAQMALLQNLADYGVANTGTQNVSTGNVNASDNGVVGNASSGDALAIMNYLNLLNSMWSWATGGLNYFIDTIFGNQNGDILLNPAAVSSSGAGGSLGAAPSSVAYGGTSNNSSADTSINNDNGLTVVNKPTGAISNDINTSANSGNVTLNDNGQTGNGASGDAAATINLINMINSAIGAGQSFFGMLNIFGNFNGNLLFPSGFLNAAMPSQAGAPTNSVDLSGTSNNSSTNTNINNTNTTTVTNAPTAAFNNTIGTDATTGAVSASDNGVVGNATSGNASALSSLFNLFNTNVSGDNGLLVLVNVMGHWVGGILGLGGFGNSGAALLTGGASVTQNGTSNNSSTNTNINHTNTTDITNAPSGTITNNITAGAHSGNVSADDNGVVGNLTSGNASVASSVANLFGSTMNFTHWFGVLVINVFGDWNGGVQQQPDTAGMGGPVTAQAVAPQAAMAAIRQVATHYATVVTGSAAGNGDGSGTTSTDAADHSVIAQLTSAPAPAAATATTNAAAKEASSTSDTSLLLIVAAAALLLAGALGSLDRRLRQK